MELQERRRGGLSLAALLGAWFACAAAGADAPAGTPAARANFGPYNVVVLAGGVGIHRPLAPDSALLSPGAAWSLSGWLRPDRVEDGALVVAAIGDPDPGHCRCLLLDGGRLAFRPGPGAVLRAPTPIAPGTWHSVVASFDGSSATLSVDGVTVAAAPASSASVGAELRLAPESATDPAGERHFGGALALFSVADHAEDERAAREFDSARPNFALIAFHEIGVGWPWQEHAWRGLQEPQPAWTLPRARAPASAPVFNPPPAEAALTPAGREAWTIGAWRLSAAPLVAATPQQVSMPDYLDAGWYRAVVPGTVLTTLIANGVYPDPDVGLNNLAIPESLSRQDYWYRTQFRLPAQTSGRRLTVTFKGINYAAEIWLNGTRVGATRGAFIRGAFDVTALVRGGDNALAVRVSPPPHPGIPHEQSVAAGPGENGGNLAIDGPTFIATEGWDWIPAIRDRNTGLWQGVELTATGLVRILDPQVTSHLPLPRTDSAELDIRVPIEQHGPAPARVRIEASLDGVRIAKDALVEPGTSVVHFGRNEFQELRIAHPRLWWPNGYGAAELYELRLVASIDGAVSDTRTVRFGIRELSYELSLFDHEGRLRRVEVDPAAEPGHEPLVDVRHAAIKRTATGWAESLTAAGEASAAVRAASTLSLTPYLVIRVNGVAIAARGGSWGMDDSRKRSSRQRLEPFFRLHRAAHLNIIRNWLGQNTEEVFYDLADEYGLLVLNDFWASTQDFQVEPQDPQLFLANAADVIRRYRNHPSIAVWFGRNEGVPQPIINEGLAELVATLDGTRYYTGSSNSVNLQGSGPYNWRPAEQYFTTLAGGFSVEVGTPSLASLESLEAWIPQPDRWPLGDTFAYHDWHFGGNGDTASFMQALERGFGAASGLADFERKAQMLNYVSYRAVFEGFQAHLWSRNSGRLLWMTHPSWPSNAWQIYSSDYDTAAAYYAVAKACEPLHPQLDLPDFRPAVVNTTRDARRGLRLRSRVLSLANRVLLERTDRLDVPANDVATLEPLALAPLLERERLVLVRLTLSDAAGRSVATNDYWQGAAETDQQRLNTLPAVALTVTARARQVEDGLTIAIDVGNPTGAPALMTRLTLYDTAGHRVLPAYFSDNYLTVLPHESVRLTAHCPRDGADCARVSVRGWNVQPVTLAVSATPAERRGR